MWENNLQKYDIVSYFRICSYKFPGNNSMWRQKTVTSSFSCERLLLFALWIMLYTGMFDVGPTLYTLHKCYTNVLCLLGIRPTFPSLSISLYNYQDHYIISKPQKYCAWWRLAVDDCQLAWRMWCGWAGIVYLLPGADNPDTAGVNG